MSQALLIRIRTYAVLRLLLCAALSLCPALVQAEAVGILYPETREPYRQVYRSIIDGVETIYKKKAESLAVSPDTPPEIVHRWLADNEISNLVVLGNDCLDHLPGDRELAVVVGGTILKPSEDSLPGITLNPSAGLLFSGLLGLRPAVTDIHVVFEEDYNGWVIPEANLAAAKLGVRLHEHPVTSLREAAERYRDVQSHMNGETSAIWLPLGGPSREKTILQEILETAWQREQIIFSSNLADVRRGALFALYPDNQGMGRELASLLRAVPIKSKNNTQFLTSVSKAINLRTAEHIGLRLPKEQLREFDFVYPPP